MHRMNISDFEEASSHDSDSDVVHVKREEESKVPCEIQDRQWNH